MNIEDKMDLSKMLQVINNAIYTSEKRFLTDIEVEVLIGSLQKKQFKEISKETGYTYSYISRYVAPNLWKTLTKAFKEQVNKKNIKGVIERQLSN